MLSNVHKSLFVIGFLTIIIFFNGCSKTEESTVNIAVNLPLTGDLATYGEAVQDGVTFALEDLEKNTNSLEPELEFDWQDNAGQPRNAVNIMKSQYLKKIDIYISGVKPQTMAIIDEISQKKTPHFVWIFDAFVCRDYPNTFRTWVSYKFEPEYYLNYAKKVNPEKVAIIYVNLPHAEEEFKKIVIPGLNEMGIKDIFLETYDYTKKDYKDIAAKVDAFKPDLIMLNGFKATIIGLVQSLRSLNLIKDGNTIATYDMLDAAEELASEVEEGIRAIAPIFDTRPDNQKLTKWKNRFEERFDRKPRYTDAYAYDMAMIFYDAAKRVTSPTTNENWVNAIMKTNIDGITGPLTFDEDGDLIISLEIGVYRNGRLVPDSTN